MDSQKQSPAVAAAGLCENKSGAGRSQEQGESRKTVLPGARKAKIDRTEATTFLRSEVDSLLRRVNPK
jgi:hypothetical protein